MSCAGSIPEEYSTERVGSSMEATLVPRSPMLIGRRCGMAVRHCRSACCTAEWANLLVWRKVIARPTMLIRATTASTSVASAVIHSGDSPNGPGVTIGVGETAKAPAVYTGLDARGGLLQSSQHLQIRPRRYRVTSSGCWPPCSGGKLGVKMSPWTPPDGSGGKVRIGTHGFILNSRA